MKAKKIVGISVVIGIVILISALLFNAYWNEWRFERIRVFSPGQQYVEEYEDHYHKAVVKPSTMPSPFGSSSIIIYFKPGQKEHMLEQIKRDVMNYLEKLIEEHGDVFYKYELRNSQTINCLFDLGRIL